MISCSGTQEKPRITEFAVGWTSSKRGEEIVTKSLDAHPPLLASNLAAAFDPATKKKLIVYQNSDTLHIVESTSDNGMESSVLVTKQPFLTKLTYNHLCRHCNSEHRRLP